MSEDPVKYESIDATERLRLHEAETKAFGLGMEAGITGQRAIATASDQQIRIEALRAAAVVYAGMISKDQVEPLTLAGNAAAALSLAKQFAEWLEG